MIACPEFKSGVDYGEGSSKFSLSPPLIPPQGGKQKKGQQLNCRP